MDYKRLPTMENCLKNLLKFINISEIVDIGIFHQTEPLLNNFPDLKHFLFEPLNIYNSKIEENYKNTKHELHNIALSDKSGVIYLIGICNNKSGKVTHSFISDKKIDSDPRGEIISCEEILQDTFDNIHSRFTIKKDFLLKIDVDGFEVPIINGAKKSISNAAVVIVEASTSVEQGHYFQRIYERMTAVLEKGFQLYDIVDMAYYNYKLHQVDLVFVRNDIIESNEELRLIESKEFDKNRWYPLANDSLFKEQ